MVLWDDSGEILPGHTFMEWAYPDDGIISGKNRKIYEAWNKADPVDAWEIKRFKRIEKFMRTEARL